jgi:hypothetical protein
MTDWFACIITKEGQQLYVERLLPQRTTTTDKSKADRYPTPDHARAVAREVCPRGGRYGAEPVD